MSGNGMRWEQLAAERRVKRRGKERTSASGFTLDTFGRMSKGAESAEDFIEEAKRWRPVEEVVEANAVARASKESHMRGILDACED